MENFGLLLERRCPKREPGKGMSSEEATAQKTKGSSLSGPGYSFRKRPMGNSFSDNLGSSRTVAIPRIILPPDYYQKFSSEKFLTRPI